MFPRQGKRAKHSHSSFPSKPNAITTSTSSFNNLPPLSTSSSSSNLSLNSTFIQPFIESKSIPPELLNSTPSSSTFADPVQWFPSEILLRILSYLPFASILNLTFVSRTWRHFLFAFHDPWKHLIFKEDSVTKVTDTKFVSLIKSYIAKSQGHLHTFILETPKRTNDMVIQELSLFLTSLGPRFLTHVAICQATQVSFHGWLFFFEKLTHPFNLASQFTHVSFRGCTEFLTKNLIYSHCFTQLLSLDLSYCSKLTGEGFPSLVSLQQLNLSHCQLSNQGLSHLIHSCPNLIQLDITFNPSLTATSLVHLLKLTHLRHFAFSYLTSMLMGPSLNEIMLDWSFSFQSFKMISELKCLDSSFTQLLLHSQSRLTKLCIPGAVSLTSLSFSKLSVCSQLAFVDVSSCPGFHASDLIDLLYHCPKLHTLNISNLPESNLPSTSFQAFFNYAPNLRTLIAHNLMSFTNQVLMDFVLHHFSFQLLDISGCPCIHGDTLAQVRVHLHHKRKSAVIVYKSLESNIHRKGKRRLYF